MKVNKQQELLFIHIPKCGGQMIRHTLNMTSWVDGHANARRARDEVPNMWNNYLKFTSIRNPWEAEVSSFFYKLGTSIQAARGGVEHIDTALFGFKNHIKHNGICTYPLLEDSKFPKSMMRFITDEDNNIIVDEVLRLESIDEDLQRMCEKHNLKKTNEVEIRNETNHLHYSHYYTDQEMIDYVYEKNQDYIEKFGYSFEKEFY
tara:strand:- start:46 stop:657 length:612 start_codon:yes stop_codon:yes gene_type:complete